LRDQTGEMSLAAGLVMESVEYAEGCGRQAQGEPD
jgi:hypothetical protein